MGKLYKVIKETTVQYKEYLVPNSPKKTLNLKVGDTFEGGVAPYNKESGVVYTTSNLKEPDWAVMGQVWIPIPIENVQETSLVGGGLSNTQKWAWVIGLSIVFLGITYWSQSQSNK